jgi:hypothetical protein
MAETNPTPISGDPNLGPDDVRVEIKLVLVGQKEILAQADGSVPLLDALTPAAQGALACAIETGFEWTVQSVVRKINELILRRSQTKGPENSAPEAWALQQPIDFPECLPPKPSPKTDHPTNL